MLHRGPAQSSWHGGLTPDYSKGNARAILINEHRFDNWGEFAAFTDALKDRRACYDVVKQIVDAGGTTAASWHESGVEKFLDDAEMRAAVRDAIR